MYKHYLITRFNIIRKQSEWDNDKMGNPVRTESWLKNRFQLFEKYTLPSIKNQSCKDFKWLVLFNTETPDLYKKKIELYSVEMPQFTPLFVAPYGDEAEAVSRYIMSDNSKDYVITTRIDNDDMIHRDYLARIQEEFRPKGNLFVSFKNGIQYSESSNMLRKFNHITNHYTSLIEVGDNIRSVIAYNHNSIRIFGDLKIFSDKHMWVQIVHSGNLLNREKMLLPINIVNEKELYGVNLPQQRVRRLSFDYFICILYYKISALYFYVRSYKRVLSR